MAPLSPLVKSVRHKIRSCQRCLLHETCRSPVPWSGDAPLLYPGILAIGEAPGETEDNTNQPFVGRAGQLLRSMCDKAGLPVKVMGFSNILACRPPLNADPKPAEIVACEPNRKLTFAVTRPSYLLLVGRFALNYFRKDGKLVEDAGRPLWLGDTAWMKKGQARGPGGVVAWPVYHPAALLHPTHDRDSLVSRMERDLEAFVDYIYGQGRWPDTCKQCGEPVDYYDGMGVAFCGKHYPRLKADQMSMFG